MQDSLIESSVRPNPTLVFFKNAFPNLTPPQYRFSFEKFQLFCFFRGLWAPLKIMHNSLSNGQFLFLLRSLNYFFADVWHLLESCKNHFPMVRGFFVEKCKLSFSRFDPPEKHENLPRTTLPGIQEPWDHAQMIERKILFRLALTRALYDQIRP